MSVSDTTLRIFPLVFAVLMVGWVVAYWYVGSQYDACSAEVQVRTERIRGKIEKNRDLLAEITRLNNVSGATGGQPR